METFRAVFTTALPDVFHAIFYQPFELHGLRSAETIHRVDHGRLRVLIQPRNFLPGTLLFQIIGDLGRWHLFTELCRALSHHTLLFIQALTRK